MSLSPQYIAKLENEAESIRGLQDLRLKYLVQEYLFNNWCERESALEKRDFLAFFRLSDLKRVLEAIEADIKSIIPTGADVESLVRHRLIEDASIVLQLWATTPKQTHLLARKVEKFVFYATEQGITIEELGLSRNERERIGELASF